MNSSDQQKELIIIGANPSGLTLAAQLLRYGLQPVIIDFKSSSAKISQSVSLHSGSLEIFNQLGLLDELLEGGILCNALNVQTDRESVKHKNYADYANRSEFPFILNIAQKKIEEVLIKFLAKKACPIYWNTKILSFQQNDKLIELEIQKSDQILRRTHQWMVIADGAQANMKEQFSYHTWKIERPLYQLDVQTSEHHNREMHLVLSKSGFVLGSPIDSQGRYDFIGSFPNRSSVSTKEKKLNEVLNQGLGFSVPIEAFNWVRTFEFRANIAAEYFKQRMILVGDASFTQSGFYGNAINNGIQGAHNISWKLANVCLGKQAESILYTYEEERKAVDSSHFKRNYWLSKILIGSPLLPSAIRKKIIQSLLKADSLFSFSPNYRKSSLSVHHSLGGKLRAGDRVPHLIIYDEKKKEETDLHKWCNRHSFVLLLLGNLSSHTLFIMAQWMKQKYTNHMHLFYLPYSPKNDLVFQAFEIPPDSNKMVLIRPDLHIGYMHDTISANLIDTYMIEVLKWN